MKHQWFSLPVGSTSSSHFINSNLVLDGQFGEGALLLGGAWSSGGVASLEGLTSWRGVVLESVEPVLPCTTWVTLGELAGLLSVQFPYLKNQE